MRDMSLTALLDIFCPMHVVLNATGHIVHLGPTARKLLPDMSGMGKRFLEVMEVKRPKVGSFMPDLLSASGKKLHLKLRKPPFSDLKGVLVCLPQSPDQAFGGGAVVNLSFGISLLDAVREYDLSNSDFAATDLAMEMLYMVEAKSAAMEASHKLNLRLQGARIAAEEQAFTDTLTGLKNRRAMDHVLSRLKEHQRDFALLHVDLDYFKTVNDTLGHAAGDFVLQKVAGIMVDHIRSEDTVVRNGGDEFVIILQDAVDPELVLDVAGRLIDRLERPMDFNGEACLISASIGIAMTNQTEVPTIPQMMEDADIALYAAKSAGRGQARVFNPAMHSG